MTLPEYLADVARELRAKSAAIRRDFASHRLSAGENREDLVERFLIEHLPKRFGVSTGLVISHDGLFSNQAHLVVVDDQNNAPLYGTTRNKLWPVEAVYALIEVKTSLTPSDLSDAIAKGRRFKTLKRRFCEAGALQRSTDSLFVIWAFDSPSPSVFKANILESLTGVPRPEQPDFFIVPDRLVAKSGSYLDLARLGQVGSPYRRKLEAQHGSNLTTLIPDTAEVDDLRENSLMAWYVWFDSWLRQAGARLTDPIAYLSPGQIFGQRV
jgi:hypothetical protein